MNEKLEKLTLEKKILIETIDMQSKAVVNEKDFKKQEKMLKTIEEKVNQLKNNIIKIKSYGLDVSEQMFIDKRNMLRKIKKQLHKMKV